MENVFYFCAHTGVWLIRKFKDPNGYRTYTLDWKFLEKVQAAVRAADTSSGTLRYTADFLWWLEHNNLEKK